MPLLPLKAEVSVFLAAVKGWSTGNQAALLLASSLTTKCFAKTSEKRSSLKFAVWLHEAKQRSTKGNFFEASLPSLGRKIASALESTRLVALQTENNHCWMSAVA